jgi:molecular chaperone GrpE
MTEKKGQSDDDAAAAKAAADRDATDFAAFDVSSAPAESDADETNELVTDEASSEDSPVDDDLTPEEREFLEAGERDLLADMRNDLARAQAELVNFRKRVERDRAANRDAVIAEVIRTLLPAVDDLYRAEAHGDLAGSSLELVAQKLHAAFARYGLRPIGEKGEAFDPHLHEAVVQLPTPDVTVDTVADVIEPGYALGDRLLRAAKVAVAVPEGK